MMWLMIRKRFFDQIVAGKKGIEHRDAHLTFECEETGRTVRADVDTIMLYSREMTRRYMNQYSKVDDRMFDELFEDQVQIAFALKNVGKVVGK